MVFGMDLRCLAQCRVNKEYGILMLSCSFLIHVVKHLSNISREYFFFSELPARAFSSFVSWCLDFIVRLGEGLRAFREGLFPVAPMPSIFPRERFSLVSEDSSLLEIGTVPFLRNSPPL